MGEVKIMLSIKSKGDQINRTFFTIFRKPPYKRRKIIKNGKK